MNCHKCGGPTILKSGLCRWCVEDSGQAISARGVVTAQHTRRSIAHHILCALKSMSWSPDFESTGGGFLVDGRYYTAGEAAERFVPGGWAAAYGKPCARCDA